MAISFCSWPLARPDSVLTLETDWADILTVDSLTLRCDVQVKDFEWNYTWYRDGNEMADISADIHVKSTKETYQSEYTCRGARLQRPTYSALSEAFIANNLGEWQSSNYTIPNMAMHLNAIFFFAVTVLKRKILLSISGCLVVGIVLIVLSCIILKVTRKPGQYVLPVFMYLCLCLAISRKKGFHSYLNVQ